MLSSPLWSSEIERALILAGAALLTAAAYQVPCTYRVDVGGADAPYVTDFGPRQRFQQTTWRWTLGASRLMFHDAGQVMPRARLRMRFAAPRPDGVPPPTLAIGVNGHLLASVSPPAEFVEGTWPIAADHCGDGDWTLSLQSGTFVKGDRRLGIQVDWAELDQDPGVHGPPLRTTLHVLAIVALLFVVPRPRNRSARTLALAGGAVTVVGIAVLREATVAILPALTLVLVVLVLGARARQGRWVARFVEAVDRRRLRGAGLAGGVCLALGSQLVLDLLGPSVAAAVFLVVGVATTALLATPAADEGAPAATTWREALVVGTLLIVALALRLHALGAVPFSLFRDEARHGLVALQILHDSSYRPVFVPPPVSQPAAYMYLLAWVFDRWGASASSLRLVSAVAGAAAVPLLFLVLRPLWGARVAAMAAFGLAASSWHLTISRFAMPYVLPTLLALPAYFLLRRALEGGRLLSFAGAGLALGLAQYGAQTSRVLLLVATAMVADAFFWRGTGDPVPRKRIVIGALSLALVATATAVPLLSAALLDPDAFLARTREVALWNGESGEGDYLPRLLLRNLARYAGAFHVEGDWNGRHNLPGAPLLDPVSAVFAAVGAIVVARSLGERKHRFLVIWLVGGLLPGLLSADAPTALRIIEAAPVVYALAALGALRVGAARRPGVTTALAVAVLAFNAWTYFVRMYEAPAVWRRGGAVASRLGEALRSLRARGALAPGTPLFVPTAFLESPDDGDVLRFLTEDAAALRVYDRNLMPNTGPAAVVVPNYAEMWRLIAAQEPRYAVEAQNAASNEEAWRQRLEPLTLGEALEGAPFPGSDRPSYWLYLRP